MPWKAYKEKNAPVVKSVRTSQSIIYIPNFSYISGNLRLRIIDGETHFCEHQA